MQRTAPGLRCLAIRLQSAPGCLSPAQPWSLQAARGGHIIVAEIFNDQVWLVQGAVREPALAPSCVSSQNRL